MSLEALERSDLTRLPGGIFTRAFIRAYAQEVGLDPDKMIQDFISELPAEAAATTAHTATVEDGEKLESDRKAVATAAKLVGVSLPIAGFLIYYALHQPSQRPPQPPESTAVQQDTAAASLPMSTSAAPIADSAVAASATPAPAAVPAGGLTMEIAPRSDCWVAVTVDGEPAFSGLMKAGDRRRITARDEISLNVGDAGAFAYTLNGKEGRPLGDHGEVVSRRIRVGDAQSYAAP